ncbi:UNVERIFIED_CONTAM: hypothetical protein GTU68_043604 [Idotea baltica]|nr:hypothetical protein [Idotea baltica]
MIHVVIALQLCYIFGCYNIGHQHFIAIGEHTGFLDGFLLKLFFGLGKLLPIFIVTNVVGLGIEFYYAYKKGHAIEEGFLVSGALIPLIMPPDLPIWMLVLSVAFAVWIGKEAFGGTGMNIWNIALLARVFVFFSYPTAISGDEAWVAVDGYTGATPLILAYQGGWEAVTEVYSQSQMWWGAIPGSIGETSKPMVLIGALILLVTGIASWRIMLSMCMGAAFMAILLNAWDATPFMTVPWYFHFYIGSFFFAMAFMATDPVTAAATNRGKWIYGFLIGFVGIIVRVLNPAYPEGWMLAILLMNTFAPLIDHYVIQGNITKRLKRA